jgi:hypothetical protein
MTLRLAAACAALTFAAAAPAFAAVPISAALTNPTSEQRPITSTISWRCADTGCTTAHADREQFSVRTCKALARQVGPVAAFVSGSRSFTPEQLAECNTAARTVAATTPASSATASAAN